MTIPTRGTTYCVHGVDGEEIHAHPQRYGKTVQTNFCSNHTTTKLYVGQQHITLQYMCVHRQIVVHHVVFLYGVTKI